MDLWHEQWRAVRTLMQVLPDLPRQARQDYLTRHADDPIVRVETRSLLDVHERGEFDDFPRMERFVARRCLGAGAFGTVFEAYDSEQQIVVALKILKQADPISLDRFKREFWTLREIDHPNLVKLYQLFQDDDGRWFFTMQLVRGAGFRDYLTSVESRDPDGAARNRDELRSVFLQLCQGVHALHRSGHIHRDLKPDNILVSHAGVVTLIDLGMARSIAVAPVQQSVSIVGSAHYLSPEQGSGGELSEATDWFSVGVILFEALTGRYPFNGTLEEILEQKSLPNPPEPASLAPDVPADLNALCRDLMQRYASSRPRASEVFRRLGAPIGPDRKAAADATRGVFVGRDNVLLTLEQSFAALQSSRACIVVNISGQSGIGKSTLLREFQRRLVDAGQGVVILEGRCHESARVRFNALDMLVDRLTAHLKTLLPLEVKALSPRDLGPLVRLFPALKQVEAIARTRLSISESLDSQELRERGFDALIEMMARLGDTRPLVICIDDIQWGDSDSAAFFKRLFDTVSPPNALLLISYRSEDVGCSPFLLRYRDDLPTTASRAAAAVVIPVDIEELSDGEAQHLIRRLFPGAGQIDQDTIATIIKESSGIPFLIVEFARYAAVCVEEEREPRFTLDAVMRERTMALPAAARKLLAAVAVAGQPVPASVAYKAARLESDDFPGLQSLTAESLVRVRETPAGRELETYHDRYRTSIIQLLEPESRRQAHLAIATALAEHATPDPAFIAVQFYEGGEPERAARFFLAAAEKAMAAYAFDQAAEFYGLAASLGSCTRDERLQLARLQGEALIQSGRGREAAAVFSTAAERASPLDRLELQRRAAEQYLRSGDLNEGLRLVRTVARTLGIWIGDKRWQTLISILWRRVVISLIGPRYRLRPPDEVSAKDLAILDTYWSLAVGLSLVDMVRASDFSARHFLKAARVGEPQRVAMSLALQAGHSGIQHNRQSQATAALNQARQLAQKYEYRHVIAIVEGMGAVCGYLAGDWRRAYECGIRGEAMLREERTGVRWEIVSVSIFSLKCLNMMGDWNGFAEKLKPLLVEARAKNDRYAVAGFRLLTHSYMLDLVRDDIVASRATLTDALLEWSQEGFHLQDFFAAYGETETDLYEGDADKALTRIDRWWPKLTRSLLFHGQVVKILALHIKGRSLLAAAFATRARDSRAADRLVNDARKASRHIARENAPWGQQLSRLLDASALLHAGKHRDCLVALEQAEDGFARLDMHQYKAAASWCRGQLSGGPHGAALAASAEAWMRDQGVVEPRKILHLLAPGNWAQHDDGRQL